MARSSARWRWSNSGESRRVRGTADLLTFLQTLAGASTSILSTDAHTHQRSGGGTQVTELGDFEALSFDCYGTLIDWEAGITAALAPWMARNEISLDMGTVLERYAVAEAREELEFAGCLVSGHPRGRDAKSRSRCRRACERRQLDIACAIRTRLAGVSRLGCSARASCDALQAHHSLERRSQLLRRQQRAPRGSLRCDCHGTGCRLIQTVGAELRGPARHG